ncbi:MAG TPA: chemotaxis protein [Pseudomonas sp.]|jgi:twitching motility protein PilJ|nr:chemotaxis protein [Pseudomonadales bacterium]MAQ49355.1 chemotaxis protein [Pseudomonas sp.]MBB49977.1 chemotaxis protein [Pseudomonadales bacterium]MBB52734.1 chemotaxis protein [Pseudomonadales bacterium]MBU31832.1 chemotaxis protein [Pseudomonadales bacterium]|tara:strand:- start:2739 stop:4778 length:2040 start_codon:yes stop_codon:yes gene_type:complete
MKIIDTQTLSSLRSNRTVLGLGAVLVVSLVLLIANFFYLNTQSSRDTEYIGHAGELRVLSQEISKSATEAATGTPEAFGLLLAARNDFQQRWDYLVQGDPSANLPPMPDSLQAQQAKVQADWDRMRGNADAILASQTTVLSLHEVATTLSDTVPQLQVEYEDVVDVLIASGAPADQVAIAQRQSLLAERILGSVNRVLEGDEDAVMAADSFGRDASLFGRVLQGMLEGNPSIGIAAVTDPDAASRLQEIQSLFRYVSDSVDQILLTSPELYQVRTAANEIFSGSQLMLDNLSELAQGFESRADSRVANTLLGYVLAAVAFMCLLLIGIQLTRDTRERLAETREKNERNQAAILRLLDEIGDLADGDLTAQATVTEDFTGAIADSINESIDQLRALVETINATAQEVEQAAQDTQGTAMHLAEASEHQAQEIAGASAAVNEMAVSIDQVSANASESAAVAERSVAIANKGNEVVQNTIVGMDTIREQIQDTSKRIKRLGESSQEIGDIVSLINDIADQTNILALNAAIQASMAGDAGRGFAVVADEVQRLAERSSGATKQIEALVKTIQTDTNEAVISMEQTTSEVVRGARLAQDAGVALEEIEKVSTSLAALIQNISNAARQQASSAGHISNTMNVIQEITSQTSAGTTTTARSIGELAKLAEAMRQSVDGFTLPQQDD